MMVVLVVFFSSDRRWRHTPSFVLARRFVTILKKMMRKDEKREKQRNALRGCESDREGNERWFNDERESAYCGVCLFLNASSRCDDCR